jgi:hypothetical protein
MADQTLDGTTTIDAQASRLAPRRHSRLPYLVTVALALVVLLLRLLPNDPAVAGAAARMLAPLYHMQQERERNAQMRGDPAAGARVLGAGASALTPLLASAGRRGQPAVVVHIGICSECAAESLEDWQRLAERSGAPEVIVVS